MIITHVRVKQEDYKIIVWCVMFYKGISALLLPTLRIELIYCTKLFLIGCNIFFSASRVNKRDWAYQTTNGLWKTFTLFGLFQVGFIKEFISFSCLFPLSMDGSLEILKNFLYRGAFSNLKKEVQFLRYITGIKGLLRKN